MAIPAAIRNGRGTERIANTLELFERRPVGRLRVVRLVGVLVAEARARGARAAAGRPVEARFPEGLRTAVRSTCERSEERSDLSFLLEPRTPDSPCPPSFRLSPMYYSDSIWVSQPGCVTQSSSGEVEKRNCLRGAKRAHRRMATKLLVGCDKAIGCSPERGGDDEIVFEIAVNASMLQRDVGIPMIRADHRRKFKQMLDVRPRPNLCRRSLRIVDLPVRFAQRPFEVVLAKVEEVAQRTAGTRKSIPSRAPCVMRRRAVACPFRAPI